MKLHENVTDPKSINKFKTLEIKCNKAHDNFYDYSLFEYRGAHYKSVIICPKHGEFCQTINKHLDRKQKCPKCSLTNQSYRQRATQADVIRKAKSLHRNKYDYSKYIYSTAKVKSIIICPIHKEWEQTMDSHLGGQGCPKCGIIKQGISKRSNIKDVIKEANFIHNSIYDYTKFNYINSQTKSTIICPEHGEWETIMNSHLNGCGCPKCANSRSDNDCLYVWQIENTNVYKIGITSQKRGHTRINQVASRHNIKPIIVAYIKVDDAYRLENKIHKIFKSEQSIIKNGDGYTEFRTLNDMEVIGLLDYLKKEMIDGTLNYPV